MGKSLNRDERKHSKYLERDDNRRRKERQYNAEPEVKQNPRPKKTKWRTHSKIDVD